MRFSFSWIFLLLFVAFILHSIWNLLSIFRTPTCERNEVCYKYYLNSKPNLDLLLYLTDNSRSGNTKLLLNLEKFDYSDKFERTITVDLSKPARNNGSLFIHTVIIPSQKKRNNELLSLREAAELSDATYLKHPLTKYYVPARMSYNLLKDEKASKTQSGGGKPVTHLQTKFGIMMCTEEFGISNSHVPMELERLLRVNSQKRVLPIVVQDTMQMRLRDFEEITPEDQNKTFTFTFSPASVGKIRFVRQIEGTLHEFIALGFTDKDLDEAKGVFADTNLYLLCATVLIASVHLLLDFLTFKNDVYFWRSQKSMAGLSSKTVFWRAFSQTVIFLYLLDEGTSLLVLIPSGIATLIEFWKVSKVLKGNITWKGIKFNKDGADESVEERKTREYDDECMRYLSYLLYPLCASAAVYSLLYQPHKSWYSWTVNSLVNAVYAFGFLFMLPQLFINYRLKSVAALPWRAFTYRACNTFIDDIFAFIITMPTAHRVACFRDDVVFLVYLYQRWLYPVDKTRVEGLTGDAVIEDVNGLKKDN